MEKLYIKFEEWNKYSLNEACEKARELGYRKMNNSDALKFKWYWILRLDSFWEYITSIHNEKDLIDRWYRVEGVFISWEEVIKPKYVVWDYVVY